jgi:hypothetical protein
MHLLCNLGFHSWQGATCTKCGKTREKTYWMVYADDSIHGEYHQVKAERYEHQSPNMVFFNKKGKVVETLRAYGISTGPFELPPPTKPEQKYFTSVALKTGCPECSDRKKRKIKIKFQYSSEQSGYWRALGFICPLCSTKWEVHSACGLKPHNPAIESLLWLGKDADAAGFRKTWITKSCAHCGAKLTVHRQRDADQESDRFYQTGKCSVCNAIQND